MIEVLHERFLGPACSRLLDLVVVAVSDIMSVDEVVDARYGP